MSPTLIHVFYIINSFDSTTTLWDRYCYHWHPFLQMRKLNTETLNHQCKVNNQVAI
jgi:hypothetical protein